ncbi:MAG: PIN domain-containing protein [Desulfobacterales bacterium]|nr:PIN domain-containing protein [Desulfobacterales bacterium]
MKEAFVDANVVLRYLTKDPPMMAEASLKLFTAAQKGKISLKMIPITVAEVVWVLESFYSYSKNEIAETLTQFLFSDGLTVENLGSIIEALTLYQKKNLDFADAFLSVVSLQDDQPIIYSFDHDFDRVTGITRLEPGVVP